MANIPEDRLSVFLEELPELIACMRESKTETEKMKKKHPFKSFLGMIAMNTKAHWVDDGKKDHTFTIDKEAFDEGIEKREWSSDDKS